MEQILRNVSMSPQEQLKRLRDHIDGLIRKVQEEERRLTNDVHGHVDWCQAILDCETIMTEAIAGMAPRLTVSEAAPLPPPKPERRMPHGAPFSPDVKQ